MITRFNDKNERSNEQSALWDYWYRTAQIVIIVYSVTSRSSFLVARSFYDKIQQTRELNALPPASRGAGIPGQDPHRYRHPDSRGDLRTQPVILLGTKVDLGMQREVSRQEASMFAQAHGLVHIEIDTRLRDHVEHVFVEAARLDQYARDGVVRSGGLVGNPPIDSTRPRTVPTLANADAAGSPPAASSNEGNPESRMAWLSRFGRRRGSSAAASNNPNTAPQTIIAPSSTTTSPAANRRVSKDEGIEGAPERALEYHRAGSRSGGGGSSFGSFSSTTSRWGSGRDNTTSSHHASHRAADASPYPIPTSPINRAAQPAASIQESQHRGLLELNLGERFEFPFHRHGQRDQ